MPIWTRHSLLNAAVQRRPGCCRRSTPCMRIADTGPGGYSTPSVHRAGPGGSEWRDPFAQPCRLVYRRRAGRLAGDRPPRYRRPHLERVALVPLPLFREPAQAEAIARTVANSGERCLLGGFIHSSNWDATAMENLLYSAARWDLDLDLHIDEELSEVSQGLTWLADHLSRPLFPGISAAATAAHWPPAATNRRRRSCASWRRTASPLSLCR